MPKITTAALTGVSLDWAVSIAEGFRPEQLYIQKWSKYQSASIFTRMFDDDGNPAGYITGPDRLYSRKWEAGGPIIEREKIRACPSDHLVGPPWSATDITGHITQFGSTPLIAAMRCYVMFKLGDEVDVPKEISDEQRPSPRR